MGVFTWPYVDFNVFVLTSDVLMSLCTCIIGVWGMGVLIIYLFVLFGPITRSTLLHQ